MTKLRAFAIGAVVACTLSCHKAVPLPKPADLVPEPPASQVDEVVILVGDMGDAGDFDFGGFD